MALPAPADLRLPWLAAVAWGAALWGALRPPGGGLLLVGAASVVVALVALTVAARRRASDLSLTSPAVTATATLLVLVAMVTSASLRTGGAGSGAVAEVAARSSPATVVGSVVSDPRPVASSGFASAGERTVVVRVLVHRITAARGEWDVRSTVVVLGEGAWEDVRLGATVRFRGVLATADGDAAALVRPRGEPTVVGEPDVWWRAAEVVRAGVRDAVAPRPRDQRALVPSLVVGDDSELDPELADDFRTTGLTHLLAVSGTNLTLVLGFVVLLGRWCGVRGRGRLLLGALTIVAFVLVARSEPSVVRAAAMGAVALLALAHDGRRRGIRTLAVAVLALLAWEPRMAVAAGFALSVLATAGILLVAPVWRDALARWVPRWAAEAIAVPAAAQLACTPVVAALSGEVSLVAVVANLLVAPAVAPATVLGLAGGLLAIAVVPVGQLVAMPAAWSVGWIVVVARWGAGLPVPSIGWGTGGWPLVLLTALCVVAALTAHRLLRRARWSLAAAGLGLLAVLVPVPTPGWPPHGWVVAACDVGQGDAVVLNAGPGAGVVVDAGPDARLVDRCLDRLGIEHVPLLVLTHFHADHVDGLDGVLDGRTVGEVEVSPVSDPAESAAAVTATLAERGLSPVVSAYGVPRQVGDVVVNRVWPEPSATPQALAAAGPNDASVVLVATVRGVDVLLTGDVEPEAQRGLGRTLGALEVDVLKVPHHGSRHQSVEWLTATGASVALVSAGRDNTYGHPAPALLDVLRGAGMTVLRTDRDGDSLVVVRDGGLATTALPAVGTPSP
ncbi:ComEC/Rec2 family competence protein [Nocardioides daphniae]|uniref:ComEC/Rec2 family competence protein n=1 Tax=Nocardioides daphniae TaxID=402297 RepID=A0A4V1CWL3_9ACTN|nr:ComEC/Rec2 family competence protein [Nocardioides daphniae]QCC77667.1 ComEC/Rec2 family competence protein [Nocardioides daphniae]GGD29636.1 membrane protein [Nocardioides daphniae]